MSVGDFRQDFIIGGETVQCFFAENQMTVNAHFEDASAGGDQFGLDVKFVVDRFRQTGGAGFVVSNLAVFDGNMHGTLLSVVSRTQESGSELNQGLGPSRQSIFKGNRIKILDVHDGIITTAQNDIMDIVLDTIAAILKQVPGNVPGFKYAATDDAV